MTEEITGVHFKGGTIDRVRLKNGQLVARAILIKQMERGTVFVTKPAQLQQESKPLQLVKRSGKDVLTTNPDPDEANDFIEGVPSF
jgi:hypothetical protein